MDYRELRGERYDAIASIGMVEHVGAANIDAYARGLAGLLGPGGRLLNHGIARLRYGDAEAGPFSERYVFPDAAPLHLSRIQSALEAAGFETQHVEGYREHYDAHADALGRQPGREPPARRADRGARAPARLAPLPARRAQRLPDGLHVHLPGARGQGLAPSAGAVHFWVLLRAKLDL